MSDKGIRSTKQHKEYYLRDGNVCFLVGDTYFRLHRHFFERESEYFRTLLGLPSAGDDSPTKPYIIRDVTSDDFAQFVWIWYNPLYTFSKQKKQRWITILCLATRWRFEEIRTLATRQLEKLNLDPIEKIAIYKEFSVDRQLLLPAYVSLCRREKLPSPEEGRALTMETVLKLASAREQAIRSAAECGCKILTSANVPEDVIRMIVAELFELLTPHSNEQTVGVEGQATNNGNVSSDGSVDTEVITVNQPVQPGKGRGGPGPRCT